MKPGDTAVLLVSAPALLTLWWYHGFHPPSDVEGFAHCVWPFLSSFVLLGVLPCLYIKAGLQRSWVEFGFGLGNVKYGSKLLLLIPFVVVPAAIVSTKLPAIREQYPMCGLLGEHHDSILWYELDYVIFYYAAWEFYFRGFLLFGLKDSFGSVNAVLIQAISSCLIHLGKPEAESIGALPFGLVLGYVALRTGSFWYGFAIHASLGVLLDLSILAWPSS